MEKRAKSANKTTTASKRAHSKTNSNMEASTSVGKTTRSRTANKTTRSKRAKACN